VMETDGFLTGQRDDLADSLGETFLHVNYSVCRTRLGVKLARQAILFECQKLCQFGRGVDRLAAG
jgi:hypothetical protein